MKLYDMVRKYGWEALAVLPTIGGGARPEGNVYFVDSGATNALDSNDNEHGHSWDKPFARLNFAISRCTANQGDIILIAPGHTETLADTGTASGATDTAEDECTVDVAGISIVGLGTGDLRPTFTLSTAADATINVTAANVVIKNLLIKSNLADQAVGITLAAGADGALIEECELRDGAANLELVIGISLASGCNDVTIRNCRFFTTDAGSSTASAIKFVNATSRTTIEDCFFRGDWNTAAIDGATAAGFDVLIRRNIINNLDAAAGLTVSLNAATTGAVVDNRCHGGLNGTHMAAAGCLLAENYETNAEGAQGFYGTAQDS